MPSQSRPELERRYDKGERRYKHVGKRPDPEIEFVPGNPRMWVGKCPSTLTQDDNLKLLHQAIPVSNGDRELEFPKKLYVVHEGAIYEGQTTDRGKSYHGYPFRGKIAKATLTKLREMASEKDCEKDFDRWVKVHIEVHGA